MQDRVTYEFAIIRLVPKVEREEFLNVGVVLFSKPKGYLDVKYYLNKQRLQAFSAAIDVELIEDYLQAWKKVCQGSPHGGKIGQLELPLRFRWLTATKSTILQCSKTHSGLCDKPEEVLEELFVRHVL